MKSEFILVLFFAFVFAASESKEGENNDNDGDDSNNLKLECFIENKNESVGFLRASHSRQPHTYDRYVGTSTLKQLGGDYSKSLMWKLRQVEGATGPKYYTFKNDKYKQFLCASRFADKKQGRQIVGWIVKFPTDDFQIALPGDETVSAIDFVRSNERCLWSLELTSMVRQTYIFRNVAYNELMGAFPHSAETLDKISNVRSIPLKYENLTRSQLEAQIPDEFKWGINCNKYLSE